MFDAHKNFALALVDTPPSPAASGTSLTLVAGQGALFPAAPFNVVVVESGETPTSFNSEVLRVTAVVGDVLTIVRQQEGSSARTIEAGDVVALSITAKTITDIEDAIGVVQCPDNATNYRWVPRVSDDGETIVGEWQPA